MRICMILEGCYPYVTGGVSSWMHQYIQAMPEHEFVLLTIGASSKDRGRFKYTLPENVTVIEEIFLDEALKLKEEKRRPFAKRRRFTQEETDKLMELIHCGKPDWDMLFQMYQTERISPLSFLMSEEFLKILTDLCHKEYEYVAFSDLFHTIRSMLLPLLYIMGREVPKADIYHSVATGYSGVLAVMAAWKYGVPCMLTEHGIYTREREEEIIRAKWVAPSFKRYWVRFFYMLSDAIYSRAAMVTSLFGNARKIQIEMGCDPDKCVVIPNGVRYERFCDIPLKEKDGFVDIGAVLRIAPIKDVKTLIYAFYEMKFRVENARLHIIGPEDDEEYTKECYELVSQLGVRDIVFTGQTNVIEYMKKLDFTVLSSISEGQPLAVLESFAAGRPCVTTDVGCCRELLFGMEGDTLGSAGLCVPPMHRQALCAAMETLCVKEEERYQMGRIGQERAKKYYRHEGMIRNYQNAYKEVMKRWQG